MNDISSRLRHVLISTRLFACFQRHVRWETGRNVEVHVEVHESLFDYF